MSPCSWAAGNRQQPEFVVIPLLTSGIQAPPLPLDTLKVTCQGVLSWLEALADMFPTPQMVSVSLETSVDEDRWGGGG